MMKNKSNIYPSVWKVLIYSSFAILCFLLARTGVKGVSSTKAVDPRFLVIIFTCLLLGQIKYIRFEHDQIIVYYLFVAKRKIRPERISRIEFVSESGSCWLLISLDDIESFDSYKNTVNRNGKTKKAFDYIFKHGTKVVYLEISSKKCNEYFDIVHKYYSDKILGFIENG